MQIYLYGNTFDQLPIYKVNFHCVL